MEKRYFVKYSHCADVHRTHDRMHGTGVIEMIVDRSTTDNDFIVAVSYQILRGEYQLNLTIDFMMELPV